MKIQLSGHGGHFCEAWEESLGGSMEVGSSIEEAIGRLILNHAHELGVELTIAPFTTTAWDETGIRTKVTQIGDETTVTFEHPDFDFLPLPNGDYQIVKRPKEVELNVESEEIVARPSRFLYTYDLTADVYTITRKEKVITMKNIQVCSRTVAAEKEFSEPWAAIQISGEFHKIPQLHEANLVSSIQLVFMDVEFAGRSGGIDTEQAQAILNFVCENADKVETLLVHCDAGQSRSAAVAAAISFLYGLEEEQFHKPPYTPNMLVYRMILNEATKMTYFKPVFDKIAAARQEPVWPKMK